MVPLIYKHKSGFVFLAGIILGFFLLPQRSPEIKIRGGVFNGRATVLEVPKLQRDSKLCVLQGQGKRYRLRVSSESELNLGDVVELHADIVPLPELGDRSRFEVAELVPRGRVSVVNHGFVGWEIASRFRGSFVAFIHRFADPADAGLLDAVVLNVTGDLGRSTYDALRNTGTVHIISASGLHTTIISGFIGILIFLIPIPRIFQLTILWGILFLYAAAAGFNPPIVRSALMIALCSGAFLAHREPDILSALSLSGVISIIWIPESAVQLGFQLSYLSVAALLLFCQVPNFSSKIRVASRIWKASLLSVRVTLVASLATTPLIAYTFGQFPTVTVIANYLVAIVLPLVLLAALLGWMSSFLWLGLGVGLLKYVAEPMIQWVVAVIGVLNTWKWSIIPMPPFSPYWLVAFYLLFFSMYRFRRRDDQGQPIG